MKNQQNDPRYQTVTSLVEEHDRMKGSLIEIAAISAKLLDAIKGAIGDAPAETMNIPAATAEPRPAPRKGAGTKPAKLIKHAGFRRPRSFNDAVLASLPNTFTTSTVAQAMKGAVKQASNACCSWVRQGMVTRTGPGEFMKTHERSQQDEPTHTSKVASNYQAMRAEMDASKKKDEA